MSKKIRVARKCYPQLTKKLVRSLFGAIVVVCLLGCASIATFAQDSRAAEKNLRIQDLRISESNKAGKQSARVVIELDRAAPLRIFTLKKPERLIIDFPRADTSQLLPPASFVGKANGLLAVYRYGLFRPEVLRFVFQFKQPIAIEKHGTLAANASRGFRVFVDSTRVLDARLRPPALKFASKGWQKYMDANKQSLKPELWGLAKDTKASAKARDSARLAAKSKNKQESKSITNTQSSTQARTQASSRQTSSTKYRIVIDAGHGGIDTGARANGLKEKNIVLKFAREIARTLTASGRYKVFLTRDGDYFIPLRQRYEIAQRSKADLLISVHADYLKNKAVRGASVYTLSEVASDRESAELASRENNADVIVGQDLSEFTPDVSTILIDLARKSTNRKSWRVAESFVASMKKNIPTLRKTHRHAGFVVLKSPNVPSLLLEVGYMSNKKDVQNIKRTDFRKKVSRLVLKSLDAYFKDR